MLCFTVSELIIYKGISNINDGIGINGRLATIADGVNFPQPIFHYVTSENYIQPFDPPPKNVIMRANLFQLKNVNTGISYTPVIFGDVIDQSHVLVLWIFKLDSPNRIDQLITAGGARIFLGPVSESGYIQYLFRMSRGSHVFGNTPDKRSVGLSFGGKLQLTSSK